MAEIIVKDNESIDSALRRFKRQCARSGVLSELRKREHYEKPSVKRKKAQIQITNLPNKKYRAAGTVFFCDFDDFTSSHGGRLRDNRIRPLWSVLNEQPQPKSSQTSESAARRCTAIEFRIRERG